MALFTESGKWINFQFGGFRPGREEEEGRFWGGRGRGQFLSTKKVVENSSFH